MKKHDIKIEYRRKRNNVDRWIEAEKALGYHHKPKADSSPKTLRDKGLRIKLGKGYIS